ncbi:MAG: GtrA family protein [Saprospiraceae bacterium]|nr:GtrA family protein [Saprospiraceae bacterium]
MNHFRNRIKKNGALFVKFAVTGALASVVNFGVFNVLVYFRIFSPVISDMIAYGCGVIFNFTLHKRFIFEMKGSATTTFMLYILVSLGGMALSAGLTYLFVQIPFFSKFPYIMKIITMGLVFFYNFFSKRFAFERRFFSTE